jgi:hypothetical protein
MLTRTTIPEPLRQLRDAPPPIGVPYDDEDPGLRVLRARGVHGGVEDPGDVLIRNRIGHEGAARPLAQHHVEEELTLTQARAG